MHHVSERERERGFRCYIKCPSTNIRPGFYLIVKVNVYFCFNYFVVKCIL